MSNRDNTHASILLDASGSMNNIWYDTLAGINLFLADQKTQPGTLTVSLSTFNSRYRPYITFGDISSVELNPLRDVYPQARTALYDAIHSQAEAVQIGIAGLNPRDRPSKVLCFVVTDGMENQSNRYNARDTKKLVDLCWQVQPQHAGHHEGVDGKLTGNKLDP